MNIVYSKNDVPIRLTDERWNHIVENHNELAGRKYEVLETIAESDLIAQGRVKEFLAAKKINKRWIVGVYKEVNKKDGFIITAFITSKIKYLLKKKLIWTK